MARASLCIASHPPGDQSRFVCVIKEECLSARESQCVSEVILGLHGPIQWLEPLKYGWYELRCVISVKCTLDFEALSKRM